MLGDESHHTALMQHIAEGDADGMLELWDAWAPSLLALAQQILGPSCEAEELLHEVFLEVWRKAPSYEPTRMGSVCAWLTLLTRKRALAVLLLAPELENHGLEATFLPMQWRAHHRDPMAISEGPRLSQSRRVVRQALGRMPEALRRQLELRFFRGLTGQEVATHVKTSPRQIYSQWLRCQHALAFGLHMALD